MSNRPLPKDKSAYKLFKGMRDLYFGSKAFGFERDGVNAYVLEIKKCVAFIFTNEEESHYYWCLAYAESDANSNINYDNATQSQADFPSFEKCVYDMNWSFLKLGDVDFFEKSRYEWHFKPSEDYIVEAYICMKTRRGRKLIVEAFIEYDKGCTRFFGFRNNDWWHSQYNDGTVAATTILELQKEHFGSKFNVVVKDVSAIDDFLDEVRMTTGITVSEDFLSAVE